MKWIVLSFVYMLSGVYGGVSNNTNNGTADGHVPVDNSSISTNNITGNNIRLKTNNFEGLVTSIKLSQPTVRAPEDAKADEATTRLKHAKEKVTVQNGAKGVPSGNRLPRQTYSKISISKPSFETTRGKNWCAYVHTRLSPTVVMDNVESYVTMSTEPCSWNTGGCPVRYQMMNRPAYRMRHKIVTSLEWKCCPGYTGSKCEPKAQQSQTPASESQDESDTAVSEGPAADQQTPDPAFTLKMTDQIYSQEMKLTILQKKMDSISTNMSDVRSMIFSLEGKMNEESEKDLQSTLKAEYVSCSSSPCQNGGTCINERSAHVCACRPPFGGVNCSVKLVNENNLSTDFSKGSYRYAPMVTFFVAHTFEMKASGIIKFNHLYVNYGASYSPGSGKFVIPYLGVYVFKYTIESCSPQVAGYLVVDEVDKLAFQSEDATAAVYSSSLITGDAMLELNYGQKVWLRLEKGSIPSKYPPVTTFGGYLLYRT